MPTWVQATILGIVQGLTEFLPVSSTAHLLVLERQLGFDDPNSVFTEMIQLGSILAIAWLYRARLLAVARGLPSRPEARRFVLMLGVAVVPALLAGAFGADFVEQVLHHSFSTMAVALIAGGLFMLGVERMGLRARTRSVDETSVTQALGIGLFQVLALIPGVSRSGATIIGGLVMGLERPAAAEFSFFLAIPTMSAAFAHSMIDLRHQLDPSRAAEVTLGFVWAFIASVLVVEPFLAVIRRSGFAPFAWYRIVAGAALLAAVAAGWLAA
ncbi:MAG: undecaprenyl-diphosphate phosphatase [Vicinamibacterales bacterium]